MKLQNGKRIIIVSISIAIIIAVVVIIAQYIMGIVKREKTKELQADLLLVQAKVEIVKGKNNMNKDENPLKGWQLLKVVEKFKMKDKVKFNNISAEELDKFYFLKDSELSTMDLQELVGKNKGYYIVNYDNYEVIYTLGYENANGLWCYKISDLNKQPENPVAAPASSTSTEENKAESGEQTANQEENKQENTNAEQQTTSETNQDNQANQTEENKPEETSQVNIENAEEKRAYILNKIKNVIK